MTGTRLGRRMAGIERGDAFEFVLDGERVVAYPGETIAAALLAAGQRVVRHTARRGEPRGLYCAMGVCGECAMTVNGEAGVRTCMTAVVAGMIVNRQRLAVRGSGSGSRAPRAEEPRTSTT